MLIGVPEFISVCHDDDARECAASDVAAYGRYAGEVAEHTRGAINLFEIINEPDSSAMFRGSPEDYARMLSAAYREIKARSPASAVLDRRVSGTIAKDWLGRVFATPGVAAATKFDIANVHVRGGLSSLNALDDALARLASPRTAAATRRCGSPSTAIPPTRRTRTTPGTAAARRPRRPSSETPFRRWCGRGRADLREHARQLA